LTRPFRPVDSQFINRAAFAIPALGTYGDAGFFSFNGFANWGLDAALSRVFPLPGGHRIEGRVEAFNLTNAVIPNDPSTTWQRRRSDASRRYRIRAFSSSP
jgi:hypothetical protein